jgi:hypothetical protein
MRRNGKMWGRQNYAGIMRGKGTENEEMMMGK